MVPDSRGSAAVFALLVATVLLAGSLWLYLGTGGPLSEERLGGERENGAASAGATGDLELVTEATALSNEILESKGTLAAPAGLAFNRSARTETPPPVEPAPTAAASIAIEASVEESRVVLRWNAVDARTKSFLVERLDENGAVTSQAPVPASAREYRDEPLTAIVGTGRYRVKAIGPDEEVLAEGRVEVPFSEKVEVFYLGVAPDGRARFRTTWPRDGRELEEVFLAAPGEVIGTVVAEKDGRPELDWRTGIRFVGLGFKRRSAERKTRVPRFGPDGRLDRDPDTGDAVVTEREMPVVLLTEGAVVAMPGPGSREVWLPKEKD